MMCLSQTAGYAIHALSVVAHGKGQLCLIREIARVSGIPKPYLAKIVSQLSREGLVAAKRGYRGGIYLTREPEKISLLDIVEAIDGKDFIGECMLGLTDCSTPCLCPSRAMWSRLRDEIRQALRRSTLAHVLQVMGSPSAGKLAQAKLSPHFALPLVEKSKARQRSKSSSGRAKQPVCRALGSPRFWRHEEAKV